eukprot:GHVR01096757.1.p1 GENE.GHVR01096757.1~~GHVR01096757.1.p1  ORF type:complete len:138 (+),score=31.61 GHVR01096757.1:73-486(+)
MGIYDIEGGSSSRHFNNKSQLATLLYVTKRIKVSNTSSSKYASVVSSLTKKLIVSERVTQSGPVTYPIISKQHPITLGASFVHSSNTLVETSSKTNTVVPAVTGTTIQVESIVITKLLQYYSYYCTNNTGGRDIFIN